MLKTAILCGTAAFLVMVPSAIVPAQSVRYNCQNVPVPLDVGGQPMRDAIDTLSRQTHCPISADVDVGGITGNLVKGRMTPAAAVIVLVKGTGLEGMPIHGGLGIGRYDQDAFGARVVDITRQIDAAAKEGRITHARAATLRRQLNAVTASVRQVAKQQGFVSAAEKASYRRTLAAVAKAVS